MRLNKSVTTRVTLVLMLAGIMLSGLHATVQEHVVAGSSTNTGAHQPPLRSLSPFRSAADNGGKIVFSADGEIYIMNADGSQQTRLTDGDPNVEDCQPALSPDGTRIAFNSNRSGGNYNIYVMDVDGTHVQKLTNATAPESSPAWSPDGSRIAYVLGHDLTVDGGAYFSSCGSEIYVVDADGSNRVNLTEGAGGSDPAWSPDGNQIAFSSYRTGNYEIFVMDRDGKGVKQLTFSESAEGDPAWSPDGKLIAYGGDYTLYSGEDCGFIHTGRDPSAGRGSNVYVMTVDGAHQVRLTTAAGSSDPVWSPSGTRIAFVRHKGDYAQISWTNADGSNQTNLTVDGSNKSSPSWSSGALLE